MKERTSLRSESSDADCERSFKCQLCSAGWSTTVELTSGCRKPSHHDKDVLIAMSIHKDVATCDGRERGSQEDHDHYEERGGPVSHRIDKGKLAHRKHTKHQGRNGSLFRIEYVGEADGRVGER